MPRTAKPSPPASYEAALAELEQRVAAMENGQLPLDELLQAYQRGADLLGYAWVPADAPAGLGEAMRYACSAAASACARCWCWPPARRCRGRPKPPVRAAVAVELIHAYSLVHDDMPCMDNDVLRRGKPTVHVQFGEAQAMLAGDAMQALAFEVLTPDHGVAPALQARLCRCWRARRARRHGRRPGHRPGRIGKPLSERQLRDMHRAQDRRCCCGQRADGRGLWPHRRARLAALRDYGSAIGLAFQVVDDILDVTQDSETLGKTAGKDEEANKPTFVSLLGLEASRQYAARLRDRPSPRWRSGQLRSQRLRLLADRVVARDN
jgi:farnesyl diphosphate synthase